MAKRDLRSLTPISGPETLERSNILFGAPALLSAEPATFELGALHDYINAGRVDAPAESLAHSIARFEDGTGQSILSSLATIDDVGNIETPARVQAATRKLAEYDDIAIQVSVPAAPAAGYVRLFARRVGGLTRIGIIDEDEAVSELTALLGDVFGPASAVTDNHAVVFDGISGKILKSAGASPSLVGHTHDDRYYTEAEVDALILAAVSTATAAPALLDAIKTVDGTGSGLDADTLDGHDASYFQVALGYTAEDAVNKDTDVTLAANSDTKYPSQKAIKSYVDAVINGLINSAPGTLDTLGEIAAQMATDESAVAALTTTVAGKLTKSSNLSDLTDASVARTNLGLAIGANVQAYSANLATYAGVAPSADAQSILGAANYAAMRALLDLEAGTDFYSKAAADAAFAAIGRLVSAGDGLTGGGSLGADRTIAMSSNSRTGTIPATIGDGQTAITTGTKGFVTIDFNCTITGWSVVGDAAGSIVLDVWKAAGAAPSNANSITASAKPTLSSAQYAASSTLTGWTTAVAAGDVLGFEVESAATVKQITLSLKFVKP